MNLDIFSGLQRAIGEGVQMLEEEYAKVAEDRIPALKQLSELASQLTPGHAAYQALSKTLADVRQEMAGVPQDVYLAFEALVRGIETDVGGIAKFVRGHGLSVHPAFARTVEALGLPPILPTIPEPTPEPTPEPVDPEPVSKPSKAKKVIPNEESSVQDGAQESADKPEGSESRSEN